MLLQFDRCVLTGRIVTPKMNRDITNILTVTVGLIVFGRVRGLEEKRTVLSDNFVLTFKSTILVGGAPSFCVYNFRPYFSWIESIILLINYNNRLRFSLQYRQHFPLDVTVTVKISHLLFIYTESYKE